MERRGPERTEEHLKEGQGRNGQSSEPMRLTLDHNKAGVKIQIGGKLTKGLGAGADPNIGRQAALEDTDTLIQALSGSDMIFVTAGAAGGRPRRRGGARV